MRYVLDSSIAIAALNRVATVIERLKAVSSDQVGIPLVAIGELLYGAHRSQRREVNLERIRSLQRRKLCLTSSRCIAPDPRRQSGAS